MSLNARLRQELKIESESGKEETIQKRRYIDRMFRISPKKVYRSIKVISSKEEIQSFWSSMWGKEVKHKQDAPWIQVLRNEYCVEAQQEQYVITDDIFDEVLNRLANDKPGRDQVVGIWSKHLNSTRETFKGHLKEMLSGEKEAPDWLLTSMTLLLPKNKDTEEPKNYQPVALQNTMYKVYTAILAEFIMDHCEKNNIITEEQAAGKRGGWGCADQLLINKMIYEEVTAKRRSLVTIWLDYQKAFDSVPHTWIIESLKLAKVPPTIIEAIKQLMRKWKTEAHLRGTTTSIATEFIHYLRGIM